MSAVLETSTFPAVALGHVAEIRLGKMLQPAPLTPDDLETPYLRAGHIGDLESMEDLPAMFASSVDRLAYEVRRGDLLVAEGGDAGRTAFVPEVPATTIIQNSLHRVRPKHGDLRYVKYALDAVYASGWLDVLCNKSTFGHLTREKLCALRVPQPDITTQRRIGDFLDVATARIDALIDKKRQLLGLLSARRRAAVDEAIRAVPGDLLPLRRLVDAFVDYRGATPEKTEGGVPLVTASNVSDGEIDFSLGAEFVSDVTYVDWMRRGLPELSDLVLTTEAPLGEVAMIADTRVALAQRVILLKPNRSRVEPGFLYASLRSPEVQADLLSRASGSTVWGIRADRLADVRLHVPALSDQNRIVELSQEVEQQYRAGRALLTRQVLLLRERREALITAAVTGRLDLANAAA